MVAGKSGLQATAEDVVGIYRLFLRRDPEGEHVIASNVDRPLADLLRICLKSEEFRHNTLTPVVTGRPTNAVSSGPPAEITAWASARFALTADTRSRLGSAPTWLRAYSTLFDDAGFQGLFDGWDALLTLEVRRALREAAALQGEVFGSDGWSVNGWARWLDRTAPVEIVLWSGEAVIGRGLATAFDRALEQRVPGFGGRAFRIALPAPTGERMLSVEVREASTGRVLGALDVRQSILDRGAIGDLSRRLDAVATEVSALQQFLPDIARQAATPLEAYGDYHRRWFSCAREAPPYSGRSVAVVLDGLRGSVSEVEAAFRALILQSHARLAIYVIVADADYVVLNDAARRYARTAGIDIDVLKTSELERCEGLKADYVHMMDARAIADRDLISAAAEFLDQQPSVAAVYFDEDVLCSIAEGRARKAPRFKPDFDEDLLLQEPYIGSSLTLRGEYWLSLLASRPFGGAAPSAAALTLAAQGRLIGHESVVLQSQQDGAMPDPPEDWAEVVSRHLEAQGLAARAVMEADILSAPSRRRHRIIWPLDTNVRVSVIIPTRDRLDLLKPCLDSLFLREQANQADMEVIIVDHQSSEAQTLAYLAELAEHRPDVKVLPYEGPFNWALMNNLAASKASGDVLVFLNNDTLAVSEGWLDELASQALRPDVGVVGVRLIYPDGTLQHGGFVASDRREGFLEHEGVGMPGHDGGYLGRHAVVRRATAVTGACMAISAERFAQLGGFEGAGFPVDGNDVELCFRVRAQGLAVLYTPYSTFYHLESKSRGYGVNDAQIQAAKAAVDRLWERWGECFGRDPFYNSNFDRFSDPFTRLRPPGSC